MGRHAKGQDTRVSEEGLCASITHAAQCGSSSLPEAFAVVILQGASEAGIGQGGIRFAGSSSLMKAGARNHGILASHSSQAMVTAWTTGYNSFCLLPPPCL